MSTYTIEPERRTLHGHFSRDLEPILTIDPGDTVQFRTLDAAWNIGYDEAKDESIKFEPRDEERDRGHALCGPIAIRGAQPGMTLAVRIDDVRVGPYGWTVSGGFPHEINQRFGLADQPRSYLRWTPDANTGTARNQLGHTITMRPFMGVMGMPPAEAGLHSTSPPRATGGNIDCKELIAGSTLFLPIAVDGGLFSVGDGHAAQGDGEVSVTAIECPMERVVLTFDLLPDWTLTTPRADTAVGQITFGFHEDLNEATFIALHAMVDLLADHYAVERAQALGLASAVADLRITQIANGVKGVHAVLPHGAIK